MWVRWKRDSEDLESPEELEEEETVATQEMEPEHESDKGEEGEGEEEEEMEEDEEVEEDGLAETVEDQLALVMDDDSEKKGCRCSGEKAGGNQHGEGRGVCACKQCLGKRVVN